MLNTGPHSCIWGGLQLSSAGTVNQGTELEKNNWYIPFVWLVYLPSLELLQVSPTIYAWEKLENLCLW